MALFETPYFVYDLDALKVHIQSLQQWPVTLWYALKANPLSDIIKTVYQNGMRVDVASIGELDQVLRCGVNSNDILHTGPAKSKAQLAYFIDKGVRTFVCESEQQLKDLDDLCQEGVIPAAEGGSVRVLLRIQLNWENDGENVLGGACVTPFGLDPQSWLKANPAQYQNVEMIGMHCFQWGNMLDPQKLKSIWYRICDELIALASACSLDLKVIDLGGGLGVPYGPQDAALSVDEVGAVLSELKASHPQIDFWLELGRYAVGPFGEYFAKVVDVKMYGVIPAKAGISAQLQPSQKDSRLRGNDEIALLVLNGGSHHLMRPAITGQAFPVTLARSSEAPQASFQIHGPLCTGMDQLATVDLPGDIKSGDWLVFSQTGAYGFTESMPWFLCHELPGEVVIEDSTTRVVREPKGADSWLV